MAFTGSNAITVTLDVAIDGVCGNGGPQSLFCKLDMVKVGKHPLDGTSIGE